MEKREDQNQLTQLEFLSKPSICTMSNIILLLHRIKLDLHNNLTAQITNAKHKQDQETEKIKCTLFLKPINHN
jgi:hypothetical protein